MSSVMVCYPYAGVFSGERERFPSWIDGPVPSDREKEADNHSSKGLFLERMSQVAITGVQWPLEPLYQKLMRSYMIHTPFSSEKH